MRSPQILQAHDDPVLAGRVAHHHQEGIYHLRTIAMNLNLDFEHLATVYLYQSCSWHGKWRVFSLKGEIL